MMAKAFYKIKDNRGRVFTVISATGTELPHLKKAFEAKRCTMRKTTKAARDKWLAAAAKKYRR